MELRHKRAVSPALLLPVLLLCGAGLFLWAWYAGPEVWNRLIFKHGLDKGMDFFNCMKTGENLLIYETSGSIYPPIANLFYYVLGKIAPPGADASLLRASAAGTALFAVYTWTLLCALALLTAAAVGGAWPRRLAAGVLCLTTAPVIYAVERGNLVLLAVLFSFAFLLLRNSKSRKLREVALLCLAIAANIKIYPALLGLLLLCDKRWKEALRCAAYAAALFFVPFLFMGGRSALLALLQSLAGTSAQFAMTGVGYKIDFGNTVIVLAGLCGNTFALWHTVGVQLSLGLAVVAVCAVPFLARNWQRTTLLCVLIAGVPGFSYQYALCYLIPAAALFFAQECPPRAVSSGTAGAAAAALPAATKPVPLPRALTLLYAMLLAGCLIPLPFAEPGRLYELPGEYKLSVTVLVSGVCLLLLAATLTVQGLCALCRSALPRLLRIAIPIVVVAALLAFSVQTALSAGLRALTAEYKASVLAPVSQLLTRADITAQDAILAVPYNNLAYRLLGAQLTPPLPSIPEKLTANTSYYLYCALYAAADEKKPMVLDADVYALWKLAVIEEAGDGYACMYEEVDSLDGFTLLQYAGENDAQALVHAAKSWNVWYARMLPDGTLHAGIFADNRMWQTRKDAKPDTFFVDAINSGSDIVASAALFANGVPEGYETIRTQGEFVLLQKTAA